MSARALEERIAAIAAAQYGVMARAQLLAAGLSSGAVRHRVRAGRLTVLHRGVYRVGPLEAPGAREMAAVLAAGPGAVVSHRSAAGLWGLLPEAPGGRAGAGSVLELRRPAPPAGSLPVDVTVVGANRGRRPGIRVHRVEELLPGDRATRGGIPVTAPARTLADLAAVVGASELERAVAHAEREGLTDREALRDLLSRRRARPGSPALRAVLALPGGPAFTRSGAEAGFLALVRRAGLPAPRANAPLGPFEVDFLWSDVRLVVEVDGFRYHGTRAGFEADRRRDAWLAAAGYQVLRLSWRQIHDEPVPTAVKVGQALALASAPR